MKADRIRIRRRPLMIVLTLLVGALSGLFLLPSSPASAVDISQSVRLRRLPDPAGPVAAGQRHRRLVPQRAEEPAQG